jgi:hypothetical protein
MEVGYNQINLVMVLIVEYNSTDYNKINQIGYNLIELHIILLQVVYKQTKILI